MENNRLLKRYTDILHLYFSGYLQKLPQNEFNRFSPNSLRRRSYTVLALLKKRFQQLRSPSISKEDQVSLQGKIWLFAISQNNVDATSFLARELTNTVLVTDKKRTFKDSNPYCFVNLKYQIIHFYKFPFLLIGLYLRNRSAFRIFNIVAQSIGFYEEWKRLFKSIKPRAIVFSNDHVWNSRALIHAAIEAGIPTIYIQHASVSKYFPPLIFDLKSS